jgi:hypothetical protein
MVSLCQKTTREKAAFALFKNRWLRPCAVHRSLAAYVASQWLRGPTDSDLNRIEESAISLRRSRMPF